MKIAIIGYGRMGKAVEELALANGHSIVASIDNEADWELKKDSLAKAQLAIEFSMPGQAVSNIMKCFDLGLAVVSGTTGWMDSFDDVKRRCLAGKHAFFYASNFSPGMNVMFELNRKLAQLLSRQKGYRILIEEIHHTEKKDAPSGTAISLAEDIIQYHPDKKAWVNRPAESEKELEIISIRRNKVPGTHFVRYYSDIDSLEVKHTAHSRKGFALGALLAAEWLLGKEGVYGMQDLLNDNA